MSALRQSLVLLKATQVSICLFLRTINLLCRLIGLDWCASTTVSLNWKSSKVLSTRLTLRWQFQSQKNSAKSQKALLTIVILQKSTSRQHKVKYFGLWWTINVSCRTITQLTPLSRVTLMLSGSLFHQSQKVRILRSSAQSSNVKTTFLWRSM